MFAPEVQDIFDDDFSMSFSYDYDYDDCGFGDDGDSDTDFYLPWQDVMTGTDLVALAEALAMGLDEGSTMGDIIVTEIVDGSAVVPTAIGPTANTAALVVGYAGHPEVKEVCSDYSQGGTAAIVT